MDAALAFLEAAGGTITRFALGTFLIVNAVFIVAVMVKRDRRLVDRWTRRLVVVDTALLLAAGGAPATSWAARTAARAVAAVLPDPPAQTDGPGTVPGQSLGAGGP